MNWLREEIQNFQNSKTIRLAYAKKLLGLVTVVLALSGNFKVLIDPLYFGVGMTLLGMIDDKLRKLTNKSLEEK